MKEIEKLKIKLADEGWEKSDGKSYNVWGFVEFPPELLKHIEEYKNTVQISYDPITGKKLKTLGKRSPVWTAYDKYLYNDYNPQANKKDSLPLISATFKSAFEHKYSPIVENIGMKIAMEMDMPTSYNYIVSFDPKEYPAIVENYPAYSQRDKVQPFGIVSIDFLQPRQTALKPNGHSLYIPKDENGNTIGTETDIEAFTAIDGDQLITFEDALKKYHIGTNKLNGEENLIENWIEVVDQMARTEFKGLPREKLSKMIDGIHSRVARSFLLKDCLLGDCDFTAYNGGIVANSHKMRYAATHDYGDICSGLIKYKFTFDPYCGIDKDVFEKLPQAVQEQIRTSKQKQGSMSMTEIAQSWASSVSEQNFYYVLKNFPGACSEFFKNADNLVRKNKINKIVDEYTQLTCNGTPLLTDEEAKLLKQYLNERIVHYCSLYVDYLTKNNKEIPGAHEEEEHTI